MNELVKALAAKGAGRPEELDKLKQEAALDAYTEAVGV
jgi:hypothetical protein